MKPFFQCTLKNSLRLRPEIKSDSGPACRLASQLAQSSERRLGLWQKTQETLGFIGKTHMEKTNAKNLIKPVENEDFLSPERKMASEMIKKALRL